MFASKIDNETIEQFKALGATQVGCTLLTRRDWYSGNTVSEPFTSIVYFFDERGVELGYWTVISLWFGPVIFPPNNRRVWHQSFRDLLQLEPLACSG
ncbi:MAG: hypothetical protein WC919_05585 [Candidatus Paceibacterota bacterium]|jgi:hypothetical protein